MLSIENVLIIELTGIYGVFMIGTCSTKPMDGMKILA